MKQVFFRGRSTKSKRWVYGDLIHEPNKVFIRHQLESESQYITEEVILQTVTQFIGVFDALFQPVFEGDILRNVTPDSNTCPTCFREAIVAYDPEGIGYIGYRTSTPFSVIGDPDTLSCMFHQIWDEDSKRWYFPNAIVIFDIWDIPAPDNFESTCLIVDTFDEFLEHFQ